MMAEAWYCEQYSPENDIVLITGMYTSLNVVIIM